MGGPDEKIFGKMGKKDCIYFYILAMIGLIMSVLLLFLTIGTSIYRGIKKKDGIFSIIMYILAGLFAIIPYILFYYQNKILYSMCVNSLN